MAFDDLTKSQREEVIKLVKELRTGRYHAEFEVDHIPSNQLEHSRINLKIKQLDGKRGFLIEFYDTNDFYSIAASRYIESATPEFDKARLTTKAYEQYKLLTEPPTNETLPSDTIKFWLEEYAHVEEAYGNLTFDIVLRRFNKWKEQACRSFAENLIPEVSQDLSKIQFPRPSRSVTKRVNQMAEFADTIPSCRRFLEEVLVDIGREGEEAYKRKPEDTLTSSVRSNVVSTESEHASTERVSTAANMSADDSTDARFLHATQLYEKVKTLVQTKEPLDQEVARLIVETSDDALEEFGNTNQSRKLELRTWRAAAAEVLPPETFKEFGERGQEVLLARLYPRSHWVRKALLYLIGTGILAGGSVVIYTQFVRPGSKQPEKEANVVPERKPPDSISVNLPEGLTLRRAIKFLAQVDNFTADFKPNCTNKFLDTEVEGGPLTGASTVEIIELLRLRLKNTRLPTNYSVLRKPEKGIYEISCS